MNKNGIVYTIIFTFIVAFVLVVPLSLANEATKPLVEKNKQLSSANSILLALGIETMGKTPEDILAANASLEKITLPQSQNQGKFRAPKILYASTVNGERRYAGFFAGPALWGQVEVAIGFNADLTFIRGFKVYAQSETPGLGGRIDEPWFAAQFADQKISTTALVFNGTTSSKVGDTVKEDSDVDGITGATLTSNGVRDIVNQAIQFMRNTNPEGVKQ